MSHTAGQVRGVAESAIAFWNSLIVLAADYNRGKTRTFDLLDPSLRRIHSGEDAFVDAAEMTVGIRVPVGLEIEPLKASVQLLADGPDLPFASAESASR